CCRRLFVLLRPRPPRLPFFPYTTLFRSESAGRPIREDVVVGAQILRPLASHQVSFLFVLQCGDDIEVANLLAEYHPRCILLETRSEEHTSELQSRENLVCRLLLEKKNTI